MNLSVNDDAMKTLVAKAIVDSLSEEARTKLITDAVAYALTKPPEGTGYYGNKRSPIQQAFDQAVEQEARRYATNVLAADADFGAKIKGLFADVAEKLFAADRREAIVDEIAGLISRALTRDR